MTVNMDRALAFMEALQANHVTYSMTGSRTRGRRHCRLFWSCIHRVVCRRCTGCGHCPGYGNDARLVVSQRLCSAG